MKSLLHWFGFDQDSIPDDAEISFNFANFPESWRVFVFLASIILIGWIVYKLYQKESNSCPTGVKYFLFVTRFSVCVLLGIVFLEPSIIYTQSKSLRPIIKLLRDSSQSMNVKDGYSENSAAKSVATLLNKSIEDVRLLKPSRVDIVNTAINANERDFLVRLGEKGRVKVLDFGDKSVEIDAVEKPVSDQSLESGQKVDETIAIDLPDLVAEGVGTDLSKAIDKSIEETLTSSVIIFTDGQHNTSSDLDQAVSAAKMRNVPLYFVGVGDPERPRNVTVSNIYADPQVWNNDPFQIQAVISSQGIDQGQVKVELIEIKKTESGDENEIVISEKNININEENKRTKIDFLHTPRTPGGKFFTIRAEVLEGESNVEDNAPQSPTRVTVLDDNAKVLLVSGSPSWEYRALVRLLTREKMINLSCWLQSLDDGRLQQGNSPINILPTTKDKLFEFDVIIMLDPDPKEFNEEIIELFKSFVSEHSGGFLYMPGPVNAGRFLSDSRTSGITELLPVLLGDVGGMEVSGLLSLNNREWPLAIVAANTDQPIMRFYEDPQKTLQQWKKLPGTYWSFPALEAKPATKVLIEHSDPTLRKKEIPRPLLVTGQFGTGRTTYLGFDGTWRWRTKGLDAEFFKRFWVQTTRYLVEGRSLAGKKRGQIETERFQYQIGDRIRLTATLREKNFEWMSKDEVKGVMTLPDGQKKDIIFNSIQNRPGVYESTVVASYEGAYDVLIELESANSEMINVKSNFMVVLPFQEIQQTWLDQDKLKAMAASTGGRYFKPDELKFIPDSIPDLSRRLTYDSPPMPLWDNRIVFIILFLLLVIEWALRKKSKLI